MRNATRRKQKIWFVSRERDDSGIEPTYVYSKPIMKRYSVSPTSGTPTEMNFGLLPTYDRYIISYDRTYTPTEGTYLYVDRIPELTSDGMLVLDNETGEPTVKPNYILKRIAYTQKGVVTRFGINKCTGDE